MYNWCVGVQKFDHMRFLAVQHSLLDAKRFHVTRCGRILGGITESQVLPHICKLSWQQFSSFEALWNRLMFLFERYLQLKERKQYQISGVAVATNSKRALRKQLWNKFITGRRFLLHTLRESQCAGQIMRHSIARQLSNCLHQGRRRRQTSNTYKASRALGMQIHGSGRRNTCNAASAGKGGGVSQETVRAHEQRQVFMVHSAATLGRKAALSASWRAGASQQARGYSSLSNKKEASGTSRKAEAEPGQKN